MTNAASMPSKHESIVRAGRIAIGTQGALYIVVGVLATRIAQGDRETEASQRGAIEAVARQPLGTTLLVLIAVGLAFHAGWRVLLAVRGEPGDDEDGKSAAKRVANAGRAVLYGGLTLAAVSVLMSDDQGASSSSSSQGTSSQEQQSTALVLSWPAGRWLVIAVGLVVAGVAVVNLKRAASRSFLEKLECGSMDEAKQRVVEVVGTIGYGARGFVYGLVAWFLVNAGWQHDSSETEGLDGALDELSTTSYGPTLLFVVALGLVTFGVFRLADAALRKPSEVAYA